MALGRSWSAGLHSGSLKRLVRERMSSVERDVVEWTVPGTKHVLRIPLADVFQGVEVVEA